MGIRIANQHNRLVIRPIPKPIQLYCKSNSGFSGQAASSDVARSIRGPVSYNIEAA